MSGGGARLDVPGAGPTWAARGGVKQIGRDDKPKMRTHRNRREKLLFAPSSFVCRAPPHPRAACFPPRVAMDAVYRAMDGGSGRVALSDEARRRKDRDAERRARRKGYAAGLTSGLVDAYWREATECVGNRRVAPSPAPVTMSGEQAVAFFSRTGLPNGEQPRPRAARACPDPAPRREHRDHDRETTNERERVCFSKSVFRRALLFSQVARHTNDADRRRSRP